MGEPSAVSVALGFIAFFVVVGVLTLLTVGLYRVAARTRPTPNAAAAPAPSPARAPQRARHAPEALRSHTCPCCKKERVYRFGQWCAGCLEEFLGGGAA
jgi:hypothetical protein